MRGAESWQRGRSRWAASVLGALLSALAWAGADVPGLTVAQKLGQMQLVSLPREGVTKEVRLLVVTQSIGGFVLAPERNFRYLHELKALCTTLQELARKTSSQMPLFLAVEDSGGEDLWLPPLLGGVPAPGPLALGASGREEDGYAVWHVAARQLAGLGLNLLLAPVGELQSGATPEAQCLDSFGADPERLLSAGLGMLRGATEAGVILGLGAFPGLLNADRRAGDMSLRFSGKEPSLLKLEDGHLHSFVQAGLPAVLVAHTLVESWDSNLPAALSPRAVGKILREQNAFDGLVISGAIDSAALAGLYAPDTATTMAIDAGADLIYQSSPDLALLAARVNATAEAVARGQILETRLDDSLRRIQRAKKFPPITSDDTEATGVATREACLTAALHGVVLVRDDDLLLPLTPTAKRIAVICPPSYLVLPNKARSRVILGLNLAHYVRRIHSHTGEAVIETFPNTQQAKFVREQAASADLLILAVVFAAHAEEQQQLVHELLALGKPAILISLGTPGDLAFFPEAKTMIAANSPASITAEAVAKILFGEERPGGTLPLPAGDLYPVGHSVPAGW